MNEQDFEKQMQTLKGAYEKVEGRLNPADVLRELNPKVEPASSKHKRRAWHIPLLSAASVLLLFGIAASMLPEEEKNAVQELPLEQQVNPDFDTKLFTSMLKKEYETLENEQLENSGLTRQQYFSMPSVSMAKQAYSGYMTEYWDEAKGLSEKQFVDQIMERIQEELYTPREIIEIKSSEAPQIPLDLRQSQSLLQRYSWRYQEYAQAESGYDIAYKRINDADRELLDEVLNPILAPILDFYELGPIMYGGEIIQPLNTLPELFVPMESVYGTDEVEMSEDIHELATLIFLSAKGTMSNNLEDQRLEVFESGVVKEEFREIWKTYAQQPEYTLSALIFRPIVEQMEQSNWTKSEAWEQFDYEDAMAHLNNLDSGFYRIPGGEFSSVVVDEAFMQKIHGHFKTLSMEDNPAKYTALVPEEIVGLYYYYWYMGKSELQYEMYIVDDRFMQIPFEEYKNLYEPFKLPFDQFAESLNFIDHGINEFNMQSGIVKIKVSEQARTELEPEILSFQVIKTKDGWKIPFMPIQ